MSLHWNNILRSVSVKDICWQWLLNWSIILVRVILNRYVMIYSYKRSVFLFVLRKHRIFQVWILVKQILRASSFYWLLKVFVNWIPRIVLYLPLTGLLIIIDRQGIVTLVVREFDLHGFTRLFKISLEIILCSISPMHNQICNLFTLIVRGMRFLISLSFGWNCTLQMHLAWLPHCKLGFEIVSPLIYLINLK